MAEDGGEVCPTGVLPCSWSCSGGGVPRRPFFPVGPPPALTAQNEVTEMSPYSPYNMATLTRTRFDSRIRVSHPKMTGHDHSVGSGRNSADGLVRSRIDRTSSAEVAKSSRCGGDPRRAPFPAVLLLAACPLRTVIDIKLPTACGRSPVSTGFRHLAHGKVISVTVLSSPLAPSRVSVRHGVTPGGWRRSAPCGGRRRPPVAAGQPARMTLSSSGSVGRLPCISRA